VRRTCQWRVIDEQTDREVSCGKPAVAHITWPGKLGNTYWYCAVHYDKRLATVIAAGRQDVLEASGVR
jgi:hypothetical protein